MDENIKQEDHQNQEQQVKEPASAGQGNAAQEHEEKEQHKKHSKKGKSDKDSALHQELIEKVAGLEEELAQKNDQYLRIHAEFDNYRKRTLKEKMELTKSASASLMVNILSVVDDFDRAMQMMEKSNDVQAIKEGVDLIYKRFNDFLKQNGVSEIEAKEKDFDTDLHDAIIKIPAPTEELKGKVVDVIQKGYCLNDKVIRFAKVVIGE